MIKGLKRGKEQSIELLKKAIRQLEEDLRYADSTEGSVEAIAATTPKVESSRKIFIVHGRDDGPREAVARFLEKLDFEVIILHEKANKSQTVVERSLTSRAKPKRGGQPSGQNRPPIASSGSTRLILNHSQGGSVTGGYPVELKRSMLEEWADHIEGLVGEARAGVAVLR